MAPWPVSTGRSSSVSMSGGGRVSASSVTRAASSGRSAGRAASRLCTFCARDGRRAGDDHLRARRVRRRRSVRARGGPDRRGPPPRRRRASRGSPARTGRTGSRPARRRRAPAPPRARAATASGLGCGRRRSRRYSAQPSVAATASAIQIARIAPVAVPNAARPSQPAATVRRLRPGCKRQAVLRRAPARLQGLGRARALSRRALTPTSRRGTRPGACGSPARPCSTPSTTRPMSA